MFKITIFLLILHQHNRCLAHRDITVDGIRTVLSLERETVEIKCSSDVPMSYCGFVHPNGTRFSFPGKKDGKCSYKLDVTTQDAGKWRCYIGKTTGGVEIVEKTNIRVVSQLAAVKTNVTVLHDEQITLACLTTKAPRALSYCRFEPPKSDPFSIDSDITPEIALLNKYYFPPNKNLSRGDCVVTIKNSQYQDEGVWTCGAGVDGKEFTATISLQVEGLYARDPAAVAGIIIGSIAILIALLVLGGSAWGKTCVLGKRPTRQADSVPRDIIPKQSSLVLRSPKTPSNRLPSIIVESPSEPSNSPIIIKLRD